MDEKSLYTYRTKEGKIMVLGNNSGKIEIETTPDKTIIDASCNTDLFYPAQKVDYRVLLLEKHLKSRNSTFREVTLIQPIQGTDKIDVTKKIAHQLFFGKQFKKQDREDLERKDYERIIFENNVPYDVRVILEDEFWGEIAWIVHLLKLFMKTHHTFQVNSELIDDLADRLSDEQKKYIVKWLVKVPNPKDPTLKMIRFRWVHDIYQKIPKSTKVTLKHDETVKSLVPYDPKNKNQCYKVDLRRQADLWIDTKKIPINYMFGQDTYVFENAAKQAEKKKMNYGSDSSFVQVNTKKFNRLLDNRPLVKGVVDVVDLCSMRSNSLEYVYIEIRCEAHKRFLGEALRVASKQVKYSLAAKIDLEIKHDG